MKVIVVGSGMGGLAAAIRIADAGHDVTVYEGATELGGKVGYVSVGGLRCDTGPSVVTMRDVIDDLDLDLVLREPDPAFVYHWPDGATLTLGPGVEGAIGGVREAFGENAASQCAAFLDHCKVIWDNAAPAFIYADSPKFSSLVSPKQVMSLTKIDATRNMAHAIDRFIKEPHVRDVFLRYATYNGSDPRVAPATLNCIAHVELVGGSFGVQGGYYRLTEALVEKCRALGVEFVMDSFVTRILHDGGVQGVRIGEQEVMCDAIVSNTDDFHLEARLLLNKKAPHNLHRSMSGWTAIVRAPAELIPDAHTVYFPDRYLGEFEAIFDRQQLPDLPTVYICNQSRAHGQTFENGDVPLFLMINAPPEPEKDYGDAWNRVTQQLARFGVELPAPKWTRTPTELAERFPGSRGAIYGSSSNNRFAAFKRPSNKHRIKGLYVASGTAHPGGGVPLCLLSGAAAARALLDNHR